MVEMDKVIEILNKAKTIIEKWVPMFDQYNTPDGIDVAIALLKEQEAVVRCKDCENWIPGYITDHDDFIPPKCGKYQQMVGHSADDYCSLAERKEGR